MRKLVIAVLVLAFIGMSATSFAAMKKAEKKTDRALEGTVKTRIGTLKFIKGYPSNATIAKLYNELDFQRAVQAYLCEQKWQKRGSRFLWIILQPTKVFWTGAEMKVMNLAAAH